MNSLDNTYWWGQIRRGKDGKLYIPSQYSTATEIGTWNPTTQQASTETFFADANVTFGGALPTQVVKSYRQTDLQEQPEFYRCLGEKQFELKDHLGNVRVLINDEKRYTDASGDGTYGSGDYLVPTVLGFYDYYPFGMEQGGRTYTNGDGYRYGFNGHERDDEIKGSGNHLSFGDYGYDSRLGRRWNVDPMDHQLVSFSPYSTFKNNPNAYVDPDGKFPVFIPLIFGGLSAETAVLVAIGFGLTAYAVYEMSDAAASAYYNNQFAIAESTAQPLPLLPDISEIDISDILVDGVFLESAGNPEPNPPVFPPILLSNENTKKLSDAELERRIADNGEFLDLALQEEYNRRKGLPIGHVGLDSRAQETWIQGTGANARTRSTWVPKGYKLVPNKRIKGKRIYTNKKDFISPDADGHNPNNVWKKAKTIEKLGKKETRDGTYDQHLNRVGD